MEDNMEEMAITYRDVLFRNGFSKIEPDDKEYPHGVYLRVLNNSKLIIIRINVDSWSVYLYSLDKKDRLDSINLDKKDHSTVMERNEDVNKNSLKQLQDLFERLDLTFDLK